MGATDSRRKLEPYDDAAYRMIDEESRIPTSENWVELLEKCLWEEDKIGDVKGFRVSCKTDPDRWIFLPYGERVYGLLPSSYSNFSGQYWTSTLVLGAGMSQFAWSISYFPDHVYRLEAERCFGMRIRPVRLKESSRQ